MADMAGIDKVMKTLLTIRSDQSIEIGSPAVKDYISSAIVLFVQLGTKTAATTRAGSLFWTYGDGESMFDDATNLVVLAPTRDLLLQKNAIPK